MIRVRAREQVPHKQLLVCQMREDGGLEPLVRLGLKRLIHFAPPDVARGAGLLHDELVVGAAPGVRRGDCAERSAFGDDPLGASDRVLVKLGRSEVPVHRALRREPHRLERWMPLAFNGTGGVCSHARGLRPCSCASTAAMTAMFTMSFTSDPRCRTCTGCAIPTRMGPIASAPPSRLSSL